MSVQGPDKDFATGLAKTQKDELELEKKGATLRDLEEDSHELDGIHDGLEFPTDEERDLLRRVPDHIPWNAYREYACSGSFGMEPRLIAALTLLAFSHRIR